MSDLSEEDGEANFTHPDVMQESTKQKQNALMNKQLKHFDESIREIEEAFKCDELYNILARTTPTGENIQFLSFDAFGRYLQSNKKSLSKSRKFSSFHDQTRYFNRLQALIHNLKQCESEFVEYIHFVLFEHFFKNLLCSQNSLTIDGISRMNLEYLLDELISNSSEISEHVQTDLNTDCEILLEVMKELQNLISRWSSLLSDEAINEELFEPTSQNIYEEYPVSTTFSVLLRFVPDLVCKMTKAKELATTWWIQAEKIRKKLEGKWKGRDRIPSRTLKNGEGNILKTDNRNHDTHEEIVTPISEHDIEECKLVGENCEKSKMVRQNISKSRGKKVKDRQERFQPSAQSSYESIATQTMVQSKKVSDPFNATDAVSSLGTVSLSLIETDTESFEETVEEADSPGSSLSYDESLSTLQRETSGIKQSILNEEWLGRLSLNLEKGIGEIESMELGICKIRKEKEILQKQLKEVRSSHEDIDRVNDKLAVLDKQLRDVERKVNVTKYRHDLLAGDICLEKELRSTFQRYMLETRGKIELLQSLIQAEIDERHKLEGDILDEKDYELEEKQQNDAGQKNVSNLEEADEKEKMPIQTRSKSDILVEMTSSDEDGKSTLNSNLDAQGNSVSEAAHVDRSNPQVRRPSDNQMKRGKITKKGQSQNNEKQRRNDAVMNITDPPGSLTRDKNPPNDQTLATVAKMKLNLKRQKNKGERSPEEKVRDHEHIDDAILPIKTPVKNAETQTLNKHQRKELLDLSFDINGSRSGSEGEKDRHVEKQTNFGGNPLHKAPRNHHQPFYDTTDEEDSFPDVPLSNHYTKSSYHTRKAKSNRQEKSSDAIHPKKDSIDEDYDADLPQSTYHTKPSHQKPKTKFNRHENSPDAIHREKNSNNEDSSVCLPQSKPPKHSRKTKCNPNESAFDATKDHPDQNFMDEEDNFGDIKQENYLTKASNQTRKTKFNRQESAASAINDHPEQVFMDEEDSFGDVAQSKYTKPSHQTKFNRYEKSPDAVHPEKNNTAEQTSFGDVPQSSYLLKPLDQTRKTKLNHDESTSDAIKDHPEQESMDDEDSIERTLNATEESEPKMYDPKRDHFVHLPARNSNSPTIYKIKKQSKTSSNKPVH